jgi:hypothetical protein
MVHLNLSGVDPALRGHRDSGQANRPDHDYAIDYGEYQSVSPS